jgi:hypothetical protein
MRFLSLLPLAWLAAGLASAPLRAEPPPDVAVRLEYLRGPGTASCAGEDVLRSYLMAQFGYDPVKPDASSVLSAGLAASARRGAFAARAAVRSSLRCAQPEESLELCGGSRDTPGMKPLLRLLAVTLALCSIGAKDCGTAAPAGGYQPNFYCYTDPPVGCAAYCIATNTVAFTPACAHISGDVQALAFEQKVKELVAADLADGNEVCPEADRYKYFTPCDVGIIPAEWPNQDHNVCTPAPPGCPI